jgi:hypothetical protein
MTKEVRKTTREEKLKRSRRQKGKEDKNRKKEKITKMNK